MSNRLQFRRDTKANWSSVNPVLMEGELGLETDTLNAKIGNGVDAWNSLDYAKVIDNLSSEPGGSDNLAMTQKAVTELLKGTSSYSDAKNYLFLQVKDFSLDITETDKDKRSKLIIQKANEWLDAINFSDMSGVQKYLGTCKIALDGRNCEVNHYVMSYANGIGMQVIHGTVTIDTSDNKKISAGNGYSIIMRRQENGVWSEWTKY